MSEEYARLAWSREVRENETPIGTVVARGPVKGCEYRSRPLTASESATASPLGWIAGADMALPSPIGSAVGATFSVFSRVAGSGRLVSPAGT